MRKWEIGERDGGKEGGMKDTREALSVESLQVIVEILYELTKQ